MEAKQKRRLETELVKMGLAGLAANGDPTPELVQQIAGIVNNWPGATNRHGEWIDKHKYLRDLFAECDQADRGAMYTALVPHLKFKVKALSHYETMLAERIGNLVSKRAAQVTGDKPHPIEIGGVKVMITTKERANCGWAAVRCNVCDKIAKFIADTPVGAMIECRKAGWKRSPEEKEICPECAVKILELAVN